jgi:SAM-dependent methyltransferase
MANEAQAAFWTDTVGLVWIANEARITAIGASHGRAAIEAAVVAVGDRVLDVGCGTGPAAIELARLVGPSGSVTGVDISPLLIERARDRAARSGLDNVVFAVADAQTAELGSQFDVVYSQFGVMFFEDPVAAFTNMRRASRPGGRLAFSCWQSFLANPWMGAPSVGAASVFTMPPPPPVGAPGPFAFADPERIRSILGDAGYSEIEIRAHEDVADVVMDEAGMDQVLRMGPTRDEYAAADDATRGRAFAAILEALVPFEHDGHHRFASASWTVTAWA